MFHGHYSLRVRIGLIVLFASIPVFVGLLLSAAHERREAIADAQEDAHRVALVAGTRQTQALEVAHELLRTLAQLPIARGPDDAACSPTLAAILAQNAEYANVGVADADGRVLCSAVPLPHPADVSGWSSFQRVLATGRFAVGGYGVDPVVGRPCVDVTYPVVDASGRIVRVCFLSIDLAWANREASSWDLPDGAIVTVIDGNGRIVVRSDTTGTWIGRVATDQPLVQQVLAQHDGTARLRGLDGVERLFAFTPLPREQTVSEFYVAVGIARSRALAHVGGVRRRNYVTFATALVLSLLLSWFVSDRLFGRRVRALMETASEIGRGNLAVRTRIATPARIDELGAIANSLDQMAASLEEREQALRASRSEVTTAYDETIEGWAKALDLRDPETVGHTRRVTGLTLRMAQAMGIDEERIVHMRRGAILHDIGKMGVPDHILRKPGPLTDDEWVIMRQHPVWAYEWLAHIRYLRPALAIPYCHHERWNGSGYPLGLEGRQIPQPARIFAVIDVWDAVTMDRPYRKAWPSGQARDYLQEESGVLFDADVVSIFLEVTKNDMTAGDVRGEDDNRLKNVPSPAEMVAVFDSP